MSNTLKKNSDCIWCLRSFRGICGHQETQEISAEESDGNSSDDSNDFLSSGIDSDSLKVTTYKTDESLKDQQSTGRKRAAKLYPLNPEAYCEWAGKEVQGGGHSPISGCGLRPGTDIGLQQSRHHGPDKNTLNNEIGNVHRICHACHNEWHAKNDSNYRPGEIIGD